MYFLHRKIKQPKWEDDEDLPLLPLPKSMRKGVKRKRVSKGDRGMGGDYPHQCTECGWGCVNSFDLVVHMKEVSLLLRLHHLIKYGADHPWSLLTMIPKNCWWIKIF